MFNKKETEEEAYRLNMAWMEAVHNGAELYVKPTTLEKAELTALGVIAAIVALLGFTLWVIL